MYYILNENIALRSWWLVPYAYLMKGCSIAKGLSEEEFLFLQKCDGETLIDNNEIVESLLQRGFILPCQKGEKTLSDWQKYRNCDNRYLPMLNLQITGKCNYNCRHCFNCKDNAPLNTEMGYAQIIKLLDECVLCGITSFTITGGEPFLYPHFMDILREIYKRNLFVFELNTNGYFVNKQILSEMLSFGCKPIIKISFDGLGFHDWMRNHQGAEKKALDAINTCIEMGFETKVQMNANKMNRDTIYPSLCLLEEMGVKDVRLIKTTNAPRWQQNAKGQSFEWDEYYDFLCDLFAQYAAEEHRLSIDVWQVLYYNAPGHYYNFAASAYHNMNLEAPICRQARSMMAISSDGEVYPCMQMQGYMVEHHISFGNVFTDGLHAILGHSKLMKMVCISLKDKLEKNEVCSNCKYLKYCHGGCPALAVLTHDGDFDYYYGEDKTKCMMLLKGYAEKLEAVFGEQNINNCKIE